MRAWVKGTTHHYLFVLLVTLVCITCCLYALIPHDTNSEPVRRMLNNTWLTQHDILLTKYDIQCHKLINGNKNYILSVQNLQKPGQLDNPWFTRASKNCNHFVDMRGYWNSSVSEEEEDFPIAFSLLVYKDVEPVERLFRAIYRPNNAYCFHVDFKASAEFKTSIKAITDCFPNAFIASDQINVHWAEISVVKAELVCWRDLIYNSSIHWKYLINLTGQEFPLKTNLELVKVLRSFQGYNNVHGSFRTVKAFVNWVHKGRDSTGKKKEAPPHGIRVAWGSTHMALCRGFVEFTLNDARARDLLEWVTDIYVPDEHYFNTLNYNPKLGVPGAYTGYPYMKPRDSWVMRFKKWKNDKNYYCHGNWVRGVCNIGLGDMPAVTASRSLFLNKIVLSREPVAYSCLEQWLRNRTKREHLFDASSYRPLTSVMMLISQWAMSLI